MIEITRYARIILSVAVIVAYYILARTSRSWVYLTYGPIAYAILVLVFYGYCYFGNLSNAELNHFNAWLGVLNLLVLLSIAIYKTAVKNAVR